MMMMKVKMMMMTVKMMMRIELNESFQTHSTLASVEITCEIHTHEKKLAVAVASFGSTESVAPACGCVFRSNVNVSLVVLFFAATNVR